MSVEYGFDKNPEFTGIPDYEDRVNSLLSSDFPSFPKYAGEAAVGAMNGISWDRGGDGLIEEEVRDYSEGER